MPRLAVRLLVWFAAVGVLPSVVMAVLAYAHLSNQDERHALDMLEGVAEARARLVRAEVDRLTTEAAAEPDAPRFAPGTPEIRFLDARTRQALDSGASVLVDGQVLAARRVEGGRRLGAVPVEELGTLLNPSPGPGDTGRCYLVDRSGRVAGTRAERPPVAVPPRPARVEAGGDRDLLVASSAAGPWRVVAQQDHAEALAPLRGLAAGVALVATLLVAGIAGALFLVGRRTEREYGRMAGSIERAARGEFGNAQAPTAPASLAEVQRRLEEMHERLGERDGEILRQRQELFCQRCELERLNTEIVQADRMKSEFVANMSHEVRTPLHSILSLSRVLLDQRSGPLTEEQGKQVAIIERSGTSLLHMLGDILDFSKIEAGRMSLDLQDVSPVALLAGVREELAALADEKGLALKLDVADDLPRHVRSDPEKLHRVLLNLAHNAIKFTAEGQVTLRVRGRRHGGVEFAVADTGAGIPRDMVEHIFEPFRQVDGSTTRAAGGTGLGLSIVRSLVELMGGRVAVDSEPGEGSTFRVVLPAAVGARPTGGPRPIAGAEDVLVVGATPPAGEAVRAELRAAGFHAGRAVCGRDVRSALDRTGIGAIVLDVGLFAHEGVDVFSTLAGRLARDRTPMIGYWVDPREGRGGFLGRLRMEQDGNGGHRLVTNRAPELPLPEHVSGEDRLRAAAWTAALQEGGGVAFHEVMRLAIDRLDAALGHERREAAGQSVLVLDPDQASRHALMMDLEALGCRVCAAGRLQGIPEDARPDLVVTELSLPDAPDAVTALGARFGVPIVVLTAEARPERHAAARAAGALLVEVKPASPRALLRRVLLAPAEEGA